jgi:hypothetical protein
MARELHRGCGCCNQFNRNGVLVFELKHSTCCSSLGNLGQKLLYFSSVTLQRLQLRVQQLHLFVCLGGGLGGSSLVLK